MTESAAAASKEEESIRQKSDSNSEEEMNYRFWGDEFWILGMGVPLISKYREGEEEGKFWISNVCVRTTQEHNTFQIQTMTKTAKRLQGRKKIQAMNWRWIAFVGGATVHLKESSLEKNPCYRGIGPPIQITG